MFKSVALNHRIKQKISKNCFGFNFSIQHFQYTTRSESNSEKEKILKRLKKQFDENLQNEFKRKEVNGRKKKLINEIEETEECEGGDLEDSEEDKKEAKFGNNEESFQHHIPIINATEEDDHQTNPTNEEEERKEEAKEENEEESTDKKKKRGRKPKNKEEKEEDKIRKDFSTILKSVSFLDQVKLIDQVSSIGISPFLNEKLFDSFKDHFFKTLSSNQQTKQNFLTSKLKRKISLFFFFK